MTVATHAPALHDLVSLTQLPELTFASGLPGFVESTRFTLTPWGPMDGPSYVLRDVDDPAVCFVVVPPAPYFADYVVHLDEPTVSRLSLRDGREALALVIVSFDDDGAATANLMGPVVVNVRTGQAAQTVLADEQLRVPLGTAAG